MSDLSETAKATTGQRVLLFLGDTALCGLLFWTPSVVLHAVRGHQFSGIDVLVLTAGLPIFFGFWLCLIWRRLTWFRARWQRIVLPVLGLWLLGPLMISISASFSGGGFTKPGGWQIVGLGTALFPMFTFMMSAYDGTLGAVVLTTLGLPLLGFLVGPKRDRTGPGPVIQM